jgi:large subunit ribosomal protein L1
MVPGSEEGESSGSLANILNLNTEMGLDSVFGQIKASSKERKFSESVELILKLNVDPSKGNQMVRGTCILPAGVGKEVRIAVFSDMEFH